MQRKLNNFSQQTSVEGIGQNSLNSLIDQLSYIGRNNIYGATVFTCQNQACVRDLSETDSPKEFQLLKNTINVLYLLVIIPMVTT